MRSQTKKDKSAQIATTLVKVVYERLMQNPGDEAEDIFSCEIEAVVTDKTHKGYMFTVSRSMHPEALFRAVFAFSVEITWFDGTPSEDDYEGPIGRAREIVAAKASHLFASITEASFSLPIISPPFFDEDLVSAQPE